MALVIVLLYEPNTKDKDIALTKCDSLGPSAAFKLGDGNGMCGPGIVRQCTAVSGVVIDQVEKDSSTTDSVLCPVYGPKRSASGFDYVKIELMA